MAIKLQEEWGDALQVLFIESQGSSNEQAEAFALRQKWLGGRAMWTNERVFDIGMRGLPACALLSPEGELVLAGYSGDLHGKVKDALDGFAKQRKRGPEGVPAAVAKLYASSYKGEHAAALSGARALLQDADPATAAAATSALAKFEARAAAELARGEALLEAGRFADADALSARLSKALVGETALAERAAALASKLADPALASEREAAKALAAAEKRLYADGPGDKSAKALQAVASKHPNTRAAQRAQELVRRAGG